MPSVKQSLSAITDALHGDEHVLVWTPATWRPCASSGGSSGALVLTTQRVIFSGGFLWQRRHQSALPLNAIFSMDLEPGAIGNLNIFAVTGPAHYLVSRRPGHLWLAAANRQLSRAVPATPASLAGVRASRHTGSVASTPWLRRCADRIGLQLGHTVGAR